MAKFRVSFIWQLGANGWSEQWYRDRDDPDAAAALTDAQWGNFSNIRATGAILRAIRVQSVDLPRVSLLEVLNREVGGNAGRGAEDTGEPPGVALLGYIRTQDFRHRSLMLKGLRDFQIQRDGNGFPVWNASLTGSLGRFKNFLTGWRAQVRTLNAADVGNPDRVITQFAPANNNTATALQFQPGLGIPTGSLVVFHGLSRITMPGFGGVVPVIDSGNNQITVPVAWRSAAQLIQGNGAKVRLAQFSYKDVIDVVQEDVRVHKVGRPSLVSRGRRAGVRYRSR